MNIKESIKNKLLSKNDDDDIGYNMDDIKNDDIKNEIIYFYNKIVLLKMDSKTLHCQ